MRTVTATAHATTMKTPSVVAAVREARVRLGDVTPSFGVVFVSPGADLTTVLRGACEAAGTTNLVGCTTAGEITEEGLTHGGASIMLVAGDLTAHVGFATGIGAAPDEAGRKLCDRLADTRRLAAAKEQRQVTSVLLTDGLTGTAERVVESMYEARLQSASQIVGGAAADESAFRETQVGAEELARTDAAAVVHVFGAAPWGIGVGHGLAAHGKQMRVTRATDNVVHEIGGEPAFNVYQRHAAERGIVLTREKAARYMVEHELGIHFFERVSRARAPLSVRDDGSIVCAAEVPVGSMVSILRGEPRAMIDAARSAAEEALAGLGGRRAAGVLLFDCVCRGTILGAEFGREVEAVRAVFGDAPLAGFLTYGEIARRPGHLAGWHNATAVVVAIPA